MRIYNVNIFSIDYRGSAKLHPIACGLVKKTVFGVKEIVTDLKLEVTDDDYNPSLVLYDVDFKKWKEYGRILAVDSQELVKKNLVKKSDVEKYLDNWSTSKLKCVFDEMAMTRAKNVMHSKQKIKIERMLNQLHK